MQILLAAIAAIATILMSAPATVRAADPNPPDESAGIEWSSLLVQSLAFLGIEHGFRWGTEAATRHPGISFVDGYIDSLNSLHGWADGDPFYVNYVGHPMQGSVSSFLFIQNDTKYRGVEFGRNRQYWKS